MDKGNRPNRTAGRTDFSFYKQCIDDDDNDDDIIIRRIIIS